ncbi:tetratricopeptide repeat protein [Flavihumibacter fluvii]|uniref:tetratricopeptide repeat protein n=1 Tax=Flavihumibacter fluvii TaxID=2838157 RepID=UPI001BDED9C2|nr:tetratricopeptide repeat protein [Flavihumibacter fluvii]ULQ50792.1 tetratricopeptide repeat protein [Flavihumibacter fluvii]
MKKYLYSLVLGAVICGNSLFAQSVEQGKKFYYYERYKSAKESLEKTLAANPNDIAATYWLGQTLIEMGDSIGARNVYQKALATNGNAPALLVGMGQLELMDGKKEEARQRFETALSLTKSKDINVANAIGHAVAESRYGDAQYVIDKLTPLTTQKGFNSAETWLVIGDAYRKLVQGGNAVQSYQKALVIDPTNAAAKHRIGKIYLTQKNPDVFLPAFEDAVKLDPNYAPSYFELYYYYFNRDINKAKDYYDKYLAVADATPANEYEKTAILFASRRYDEAISTANGFITKEGAAVDPRYYKLIAYSYDEKKDSINARKYIDEYFAKQKPDGFVPKDYEFRAQTLAKFPGNETAALASYDQAIALDTALDSRVELIANAAALAKKSGNRSAEAKYLGQAYALKKSPNNVDLYNWGFSNYQAGQYTTADSIFTAYAEKYPNEIFGYLWRARSNQAMDTAMTQGLAVPHYEKLAEMARSLDPVKYKGQAVSAYFYLVQYYNDIKKDKATAVKYCEKVLEVDPSNPDAARIKDILNKPAKKTAPSPSPGSR